MDDRQERQIGVYLKLMRIDGMHTDVLIRRRQGHVRSMADKIRKTRVDGRAGGQVVLYEWHCMS